MKRYVKTPMIYQVDATECGTASLAMIFAYFGRHISLEEMRVETGVSRDGCNAGNLMRAAKRHGLECHGYRKNARELQRLLPPCILHWEYKHFVVFEGFKGNYAYVNDPAIGRRKVSMEELEECFTGVVLTFQPTEAFSKKRKHGTLLRFARKKMSGEAAAVWKHFVLGVLSVCPVLLTAVVVRYLVDEVLLKNSKEWTGEVFMVFGVLLLLQIGLYVCRKLGSIKLQKKLVLISAKEFTNKLFRLPLAFFEQRYAGEVAGRAEENTEVNEFLSGALFDIMWNAVVSVAGFLLLGVYSPLLALLLAAITVIKLVGTKLAETVLSGWMLKRKQDSGRLAGVVCAGIRLSETIKASGAEIIYADKILTQDRKVSDEEKKLKRWQNGINAASELLDILTGWLLLLVGGLFVAEGKMTLGVLAAVVVLACVFAQTVNRLVHYTKRVQAVKAEMVRVEDIMNYAGDAVFREEIEKKEITTKLEGLVELRNVSFGYSSLKEAVVSGLSFRIGCGSSVALVGGSGCGKSTVAKLLSRVYVPWSGEVFFDGVEAKKIPREIFNSSIAAVSNDTSFFSGSIRDNITMWDTKISEKDILAAAKDACIHEEIVQKQEAYDFLLKEGASNLSGGQRQRLAIARALVKHPTVLIMDEATGALDPLVEKKILDNIKRRGCTCIVVAHRLSAIRDCDKIVVMENGRIAQMGTHKELADMDGLYKKLISNL